MSDKLNCGFIELVVTMRLQLPLTFVRGIFALNLTNLVNERITDLRKKFCHFYLGWFFVNVMLCKTEMFNKNPKAT